MGLWARKSCVFLGGVLVSLTCVSTSFAVGGHSLRFFGTGTNDIDRVKIPIDAPARPIDVGADFTVEFWMKADLADNTGTATTGNDGWITGNIIFDRAIFGAGDFGDWGISLGSGRIAFGANNGTTGQTVVGTTVVATGAWRHIAVTRRASDGRLQVFVDGALDATATGPTGDLSYRDGRVTAHPNSDPYLVIGAEKHDAGPGFPSYKGFLDEVRVSSVVRYNGNFTPLPVPFAPDDNTVGLYHFDEGNGDIVNDSSFVAGGPSHGVRKFGGDPAGPLWTTDTPWNFGTLAITLQSVATGFTSPVGIYSANDGTGRLFIVQQSGQIKIWDGTSVLGTPYLDISAQLLFSGEQGLLGLAFHPNYQINGHFFVYYTHTSGNSNIVARFTASPPSANVVSTATRAEVISITHTNQGNHNGGCIQFGPDGYLYIATGDGGAGCDSVGPNNAQNLNSPLGKMLRLDINTPPYVIPPTNPFAGAIPGLDVIWAYGLRNPWRFSFDRLTGDQFIGDVGQGPTNPREEVDFQPVTSTGGENYGWRLYEGFLTNTCSVAFSNVTTVLPLFDYDHSGGKCAVTGGFRYRGSRIPPLAAKYLYGDYCSGQIWGATVGSNGVWSTTQLRDEAFNISSFGEDDFGEIYVAALNTGVIYRIVAADSDTDGLPDWWELAYFGNATTTSPGTDFDGDGLTNLQEFIAGTNPKDPTSRLQITSITNTGSSVTVNFTSAPGVRYGVERTAELVPPSWTITTNNIAGTGGIISAIDMTGGAQFFYRAHVQQ